MWIYTTNTQLVKTFQIPKLIANGRIPAHSHQEPVPRKSESAALAGDSQKVEKHSPRLVRRVHNFDWSY